MTLKYDCLAYRNDKGQWLQYTEMVTHTGTRRSHSFTDDINKASAPVYVPRNIQLKLGVKPVIVTVRKSITIKEEI